MVGGEDNETLEVWSTRCTDFPTEDKVLALTESGELTEMFDIGIGVVVESETPATGLGRGWSHVVGWDISGLGNTGRPEIFLCHNFEMALKRRQRAFRRFGPYAKRSRYAGSMMLVKKGVPRTAGMIRAAQWARIGRYGLRGAAAYSSYQLARASLAKAMQWRKNFSRRNIGDNPRASVSTKKQLIQDTDLQLIDTRTLYDVELTDTTRDTTTLWGRERDTANISGWKICMEFASNAVDPLYFHVAIIAPKDDPNIVTGQFFRSPGSSDQRAIDFSTTLNSLNFHCYSINTDRYTVLKHRKYKIIPSTYGAAQLSGAVDNSGHSYGNLEWWVPLNRKITYREPNAPATSKSNNKVFMVWWCDLFGATSNSAVRPSSMSLSQHVEVYFRDPK